MSEPQAEYGARNARDSIDRGAAALAVSDHALATLWLERARRLAPRDPTALYLLASSVSPGSPDRALALLAELITAVPAHRSARISRIALLHRIGRAAEAARELDALLCRMAAPADTSFRTLADDVTRAADYTGWLGIRGTGRVVCSPIPMVVRLDDGPVRRHRGADWKLPRGWRAARFLHASVAPSASRRLLGASLDLASITAIEGVVEAMPDGKLFGWACAIHDPDVGISVEVFIDENSAPVAAVRADDSSIRLPQSNGAMLARGFEVVLPPTTPGATLIVRANGRQLHGSPITLPREAVAARLRAGSGIDPWGPLPACLIGSIVSPQRAIPARAPIAVILPLFRGAWDFDHCLQSLLAGQTNIRIVAIDDGVTEQGLRERAMQAAASGHIQLLRHDSNRGFPSAVNTGLRHTAGCDAVILNTDTLLPPDAIARLADAAYAEAQTGTVTPLTTDGTITSTDGPDHPRKMPSLAELRTLDTAARTANAGVRVTIPTGVGFCMFVRHDCVAETGFFREDVFAQGYGEENDFCLRAAHLGWRHVAACDVVVAHAGGASFGATSAHLRARNQTILNRLHPGYDALVARFLAADPLRPIRRSLAALLWRSGRKRTSVVLVTHDAGGGVERHVAQRVAHIRAEGRRAIVVRPRGGLLVSDGCADDTPGLVFDDVASLASFLLQDRPKLVEFHHTASHDPDIETLASRLGVAYDIVVHDYAAICPRVTLCGGAGRYCGEPLDVRDCETCVVDHGARVPFTGSVATLRAAQARRFSQARRVLVPTDDALRRLARHMPDCTLERGEWESASDRRAAPFRTISATGTVAVLGAIGQDKGFSTLLACARESERRDLPLQFVVVGHTIDDARLLATGRVFVTGPFHEGQAGELLTRMSPTIGFIPSVWPEIWCYALSELWAHSLHVVAFDLGAQRERIVTSGAGTLLPLNLPVRQIADRLLALCADPPQPSR